jgi:hypothetical protein
MSFGILSELKAIGGSGADFSNLRLAGRPHIDRTAQLN